MSKKTTKEPVKITEELATPTVSLIEVDKSSENNQKKETKPSVETKTENFLRLPDLTLNQRKQILHDYLAGHPIEDIASNNNTSQRAVLSLSRDNSLTRTMIEKESLAVFAIREAARTAKIKDDMLDYFSNVVDTVKEEDTDIQFEKLPHLLPLFDRLDRAHRLDAEKPTDISERTNKNVDVVELAKSLKTEEDKKSFLLSQIE